ncbi:MAG: hypothetical protein M0R80_01565 [Proteobacteria bacterium]|jgi:hypothetical protein|nr:hypothetical protein [Pseudomonadota bacterium]
MVILLVVILVLVLITLALLVAACFLLVKLSNELGELWEVVQAQRSNVSRLMNWVGGVGDENRDQS